MTRRVQFPDAAATTLSWLADQLPAAGWPGVTTAGAPPNPRPAPLIVCRRVGGTRRDLVTDQATLTVEAWHTTAEDAHDLAQTARGIVHDMRGRTVDAAVVYGIGEQAGPAFLPDPDSTTPRYTFTVTVNVRGEPF